MVKGHIPKEEEIVKRADQLGEIIRRKKLDISASAEETRIASYLVGVI